MSESRRSHLGHVLNRWKDILKHLSNRSWEHEEVKSFIDDGRFMERYNHQVLDIHIIAFYLMPATAINDLRIGVPLFLGFEKQITKFIDRYTPSVEAASAATTEFFLFWAQEEPFQSERHCWKEYEDAHLFWSSGITLGRNIGAIAIMLFSASVNSVASEWAFSVQNFIHNKTRNRLQPVQADKRSFVYSNARILDRDDVPMLAIPNDLASKLMSNLTPDEQVTVEAYLLELEAIDENNAEEEINVNDEESESGNEMENER
jgi:hypothetical protein